MPVLHLLRHAKSSWDDPDLADHDRPLAPRGERAASLMGLYLAQCGVHPTLVLCSSARRAAQTLERVLAALPERPEVSSEASLYDADAESLRARLCRLPSSASSVLLVGHNPALHDLARGLAARGADDALRRLQRKLPTGAWVELELSTDDWSGLEVGSARLQRFMAPKDLV